MSLVERETLRDVLYDEDAITMKGVAILNRFPEAEVNSMDMYTATEQAYKNGYEAGKKHTKIENFKCPYCDGVEILNGWFPSWTIKDYVCGKDVPITNVKFCFYCGRELWEVS